MNSPPRISWKQAWRYALLLVIGAVLIAAAVIYKYLTPNAFRTVAENRGILIAHAGGGIDNHPYTNSREALYAAIDAGFQFIELDLILTCDGHIVAAHDWKHFNRISSGKDENHCLNINEFDERKIYSKYTTLNASAINEIFSHRENIYLVTDKIRDYDALLTEMTIPVERLLVEVFSYKDYIKALWSGIRYPMLCLRNEKSFQKYSSYLSSGLVTMITVPVELIPKIEEQLRSLYAQEVTIFAYSSNNKDFVEQYNDGYITGFYTDFLTPSSGK